MSTIRALLAATVLAGSLAGCAPVPPTAALPACGSVERLGLLAQAVPTAGYVPCRLRLPAGWRSEQFTVERGSASAHLVSDRADGRAVILDFRRHCGVAGAAPFPPRTPGGRSYLRVRSLRPRFTGSMVDVFPGGCVDYRFDFARGPHIALMAELQSAVGFVSRAQLRQRLRARLGVELGP